MVAVLAKPETPSAGETRVHGSSTVRHHDADSGDVDRDRLGGEHHERREDDEENDDDSRR
jgi:hypothetical protein